MGKGSREWHRQEEGVGDVEQDGTKFALARATKQAASWIGQAVEVSTVWPHLCAQATRWSLARGEKGRAEDVGTGDDVVMSDDKKEGGRISVPWKKPKPSLIPNRCGTNTFVSLLPFPPLTGPHQSTLIMLTPDKNEGCETALKLDRLIGDVEDAVSSSMTGKIRPPSSAANSEEMQLMAISSLRNTEEILASIKRSRHQWSRLISAADDRVDRALAILRPQAIADHRSLLNSLGWPPPLSSSKTVNQSTGKVVMGENPLVTMKGDLKSKYCESFLALCNLQEFQRKRNSRQLEGHNLEVARHQPLWAIEELVNPISLASQHYFSMWIDKPEFIFALVYKITRDFIDSMDEILQPLVDKARLVGYSCREEWISAMVTSLSTYLAKVEKKSCREFHHCVSSVIALTGLRCQEAEGLTALVDDDALIKVCNSINGARYCESVLMEWCEDMFFLEMVSESCEEVAVGENSILQEEIDKLKWFRMEWLEKISIVILRGFDAQCRDYLKNKKQWQEKADGWNVSKAFVGALDYLQGKMHKLGVDLNEVDFVALWRSLANGIDQLLFNGIFMSNAKFYNGGVEKLGGDIAVLFGVFSSWCQRPGGFFPRISEGFRLLKMDEKELKERPARRTEGWLRHKGVRHLTVAEVEKITKNRVFIG
ncbi:hypothetical protein Taro_047684 [Colocasia esculenta]|uniref:RINT1-like protein MAG2 n=1 Tax=Colocasia esculenta TaxID=4460 RepID=A0A843WWP7_COLES|nr:hypothetical protein [Colocasia esculenta]